MKFEAVALAGLSVESVFQSFCGCEGEFLRCRDLDCFAGRRIAALARGRFLDLEFAKSSEVGFRSIHGGFCDFREDAVGMGQFLCF